MCQQEQELLVSTSLTSDAGPEMEIDRDCSVCRALLREFGSKPGADDIAIDEGDESKDAPVGSSVYEQRLKFLQEQEGVQSNNRGRPSKKMMQAVRPITSRLCDWLDLRRAGIYESTQPDQIVCIPCEANLKPVRDSTIHFILQHECTDKHWSKVHAPHAPKAFESDLCQGIRLTPRSNSIDVTTDVTLAHKAREHFSRWLQHNAPWHLDIAHRCFLEDWGRKCDHVSLLGFKQFCYDSI